MSSNTNHTTLVLTRDNYEEVFLLYVDEELTPDQKKAVDDFVLLHPDLKEELDLLCSTKLPADAFSFEKKEELFADYMKENVVDESLLLYMDGELPAWEAEIVETQLKRNEAFALQYRLLQKAKLDATERILYPYKNELYRNTEKRIVPYWMRMAAAVILVAGAGTAFWLNSDNTNGGDAGVAVVVPKTTPQQHIAPEAKPAETPTLNSESNRSVTNAENTVSNAGNLNTVQAPVASKRINKTKTKSTFSNPHAADEPAAASNNLPVAKKSDARNLQTGIAKKTSKLILNDTIVTPDMGSAYVRIDDTERIMDPVHPVVVTTNEQSGGVKTFLRKATRFIERRTGIKTVNDDDKLLVGAVALKL